MWTKYTKAQAGYVVRPPAPRRKCCGNCAFFRPVGVHGGQWAGGCEIVAGPIRASDGCNLWKAEKRPP